MKAPGHGTRWREDHTKRYADVAVPEIHLANITTNDRLGGLSVGKCEVNGQELEFFVTA